MDEEWMGIDDDDDENNDDFSLRESNSGRDGIIFLIDGSENMMDKMENDQEGSAFSLAIKCAVTVMKSKIISSERDVLGVVLYGVDKQTDADLKHVYAFQELKQPGADTILALEKLFNETKKSFGATYGYNRDFSLSDAFWLCTSLFAKCAYKLASRRILLFTNEDHPHQSNSQLQRQAIQKARDLQENNIELELLHINKNKTKFNVNNFFKDLLLRDNDDDPRLEDPSEKLDELLTRVRTKDHKLRSIGRIPFNLAAGVAFSVSMLHLHQIYNLVLPLKKTYPVKVANDTNEVLQTITKTYLKETGEIILPEDVKFSQVCGGTQVCFEKEELVQVKRLTEPGFTLLRFESLDALKVEHHRKHCSFIYPDETLIKGSKRLFTALLKKCLERRVMPVGWMTPRKNATPDLVALLPQAEELDSSGVQITPPGFHVVAIPFAEDTRDLQLENPPVKASPELIDKAKQMIKKLQFKFESSNFENPVLQTHWRNIEALALDLAEPEPFDDSTIPSEEMIEKRAGQLMTEFKEEAVLDETAAAPSKRKAMAQSNSPSKALKVDLAAVKEELEDRNLDKMTVQEMKDFISKNQLGIKTTGKKKAQLKEEIESYLNN